MMEEKTKREKIKPVFNATMPKNFSYFFTRESDKEFKASHPVAYGFIAFAALFCIVFPMFPYIAVYDSFKHQPEPSPWMLLGILGSMVVGIGLFNIVAAFQNQYLGHKFTFLSITLGLVLCGISILLS